MIDTDLSIKMLRDAGLTIDWQTLTVGWRGFPASWCGDFGLSFLDLQNYAIECLATASPESEDPLFRIVDSDRAFSNQVNDALEFLEGQSGITRETALRKWRYAWVMNQSRTILSSPDDDEDGRIAQAEVLSVLPSLWGGVIVPSQLPEFAWNDSPEGLRQSLSHLRSWLELEATFLRKEFVIGVPG